MTNITIALAVVFISLIVAINIWPEKPKRSKKGGRNNPSDKKANRRSQTKSDKKVRTRSK